MTRKFAKIVNGWVAWTLAGLLTWTPAAHASSRIKDLVRFENVRDNQLTGYGLVVGLNGTGDTLRNSPFTEKSLAAMLERLGVNIRDVQLKTDNVAAVTVTATLPPFARKGSRIDVTVATLGDADDLMGGTLLVTPLIGLDGEVYAVAQGQVAISGFAAGGAAGSVTQGVPTSGRIANGAIVERELPVNFHDMQSMKLALRNPDFTTAQRIAQAINDHYGRRFAAALDPATVTVERPLDFPGDMVALATDIEQLPVAPDQIARVIINESAGVIVMGADVRISRVAIAQGNLTIRVTETPQVSQPQPFSESGETVVVPRTQVEVDTGADRKLGILDGSVSLQDLVDGLNALGVGPRDMISILQALKAAGAMQAELEVI
ncbi:MAG: flagellar basal body P-ring protein FlgI [Alphaproteobacteria bacterium]|nr:MAG: flagellar basal body P-ring protein FlgI [Alphaproteobacteria bacterium]